MLYLSNSNLMFWLIFLIYIWCGLVRDFSSHQIFLVIAHRVISDKVHRLLVTLSYFRSDRFVQLLSLIPILILLLYLVVSIDLVYTGLLRIGLLEKATKF